MIFVKNDGMSIDKLLSIFKRKVLDSKILNEYRARQEFQSKTQKKRKKMNKASYRVQQMQKDNY